MKKVSFHSHPLLIWILMMIVWLAPVSSFSIASSANHNWMHYSSLNINNKSEKYPYHHQSIVLYALKSAKPDQVPSDGGSLVFQQDNFILSSAFAALDETDKYDAVLTGLCAKVLDKGGTTIKDSSETETINTAVDSYVQSAVSPLGVMEQPLNLLQEMNARRVKASPRSVSALIDTAATTGNVRIMKLTLSLCTQNGSISNFGSLQATIKSLPNKNSISSGIFGIKQTKTREEIMSDLQPMPRDDRMTEISAALFVVLTISTALFLKGLVPLLFDRDGQYILYTTFFPDIIISTLVGGLVLDNFYDGLRSLLRMSNIFPKGFMLPPKDTLPFGAFQGKFSKEAIAGLNRLITVDTERQCQSEAAAFFAAYSLGLPCFVFQPNALEAAVMIFESEKKMSQPTDSGSESSVYPLDSLFSDTGVLKILIWLLAPVAMEGLKHTQLIFSDPREASGFLRRLNEKAVSFGFEEKLDSLNIKNKEEAEVLLQWAYSEACLLIRSNLKVCEELATRLAGGASTVGDCIAVLEGW
mmetsp:Transcript_12166/g.17539  ORF Transcript_12166/g.17539 Transcript_12166/m.17539 type:complete len:528 (+) Transcript_12166:3-1586(+)